MKSKTIVRVTQDALEERAFETGAEIRTVAGVDQLEHEGIVYVATLGGAR